MSFEEIGAAFVQHYYHVFDTDRTALASLYQDESMLSFEGDQIQGVQNIVAKLESLRFGQVVHNISTMDCQPSTSGGIIVFVCGFLIVDGEEDKPMNFAQVFHLMPSGESFFVTNDLFRLNL